MRLSQNLPQFKDTPTLIVVCAWQSGKVFYALNGEISVLRKIVVPYHKYSDKEGRFATRAPGGEIIKEGSVLEKSKSHIRKEFLREFISYLDNLVKDYGIKEVYLFSPERGMPSLGKYLPPRLKRLVRGLHFGNYMQTEMVQLVKIIKDKKWEIREAARAKL